MILGKGKKIKSVYNGVDAVHMIDYSHMGKVNSICIETIGKNDAKYYTVDEAAVGVGNDFPVDPGHANARVVAGVASSGSVLGCRAAAARIPAP